MAIARGRHAARILSMPTRFLVSYKVVLGVVDDFVFIPMLQEVLYQTT